jgi:hypothetical protein
MTCAHRFIWPGIVQTCQERDTVLNAILERYRLHDHDPARYGVRQPLLRIDWLEATLILKRLRDHQTPRRKQMVVRYTIDKINSLVADHVRRLQSCPWLAGT